MARKKKQNTESNETKELSSQSQTSQQNSQSSQQPQPQKRTLRSRSKNYTKEEIDTLLICCDSFNGVINKNSNRNVDQKNKENAWTKIKNTFHDRCHADGTYVSVIIIIIVSWQISILKPFEFFTQGGRSVDATTSIQI